MNARQRRVFRRNLDRVFTPGLQVTDGYGRWGRQLVVKARRRIERPDWNKVMVEKAVNPFGHTAVRWSNLRIIK